LQIVDCGLKREGSIQEASGRRQLVRRNLGAGGKASNQWSVIDMKTERLNLSALVDKEE
jgi:hypothetical protein